MSSTLLNNLSEIVKLFLADQFCKIIFCVCEFAFASTIFNVRDETNKSKKFGKLVDREHVKNGKCETQSSSSVFHALFLTACWDFN